MKALFKSNFILTLILSLLSVYQLHAQPAYESDAWVKTGGPIGGLGYDIRHSFVDLDKWYVTDAWGGIFLSEDRGLNWREANAGITTRKSLDGIPVFCVAVDPHHSDNIWIGTELTGKIYKSIDGGTSWEEKSRGISDTLIPLSFRGVTINPGSPEIMFAMAEISSSAWNPSGNPLPGIEMDRTMGIIYKSTNGGEDWREVWRGNNLARYCLINPQNPQEIYVSTGIFDRESANTDVENGIAGGVGILKSDDGGETWRELNESNGLKDLYVGSLFMHPEHPDTLLAAASQNNWSSYGEEFTGGIYITVNGGESWQKLTTEAELFTAVEYCVCDPNIAYAASSDAVYRSDDAGFTWQRFSRENGTWGPPGVIAGLPIDMLCDPDDPLRIMVNNYLGGNFLSLDGGLTWKIASDGYTGSLVLDLAVSGTDPAIVYAGSRSGVNYSIDGGTNWFGMANPPENVPAKFNEVNTIAVNPFNDQSLRTVASDFPGVLYSYNGGKSWNNTEMFASLSDLKFFQGDSSIIYGLAGDPFMITLPEALPPEEELDSLLGLYVSHNAGLHWTQLSSVTIKGKCISSYELDPINPDMVYVSMCDGTMLKTSNLGLTWETIGEGLPIIPALSLKASESSPNILYAGLGYMIPLIGDGLYKSEDGGESWSKLSSGLEANPLIKSIAIDKENGSIVYVADYFGGVFATQDGGGTWVDISEGIDHREANTLELSNDGKVLYLGTDGGGVYRLGDISVSTPHIAINRHGSDLIQVENSFPNPFTNVSTINYVVLNSADIQISVLNLSGQIIKTLNSALHSPGPYSVHWDGTNDDGDIVSSGLYLISIQSGKMNKTLKISYLR